MKHLSLHLSGDSNYSSRSQSWQVTLHCGPPLQAQLDHIDKGCLFWSLPAHFSYTRFPAHTKTEHFMYLLYTEYSCDASKTVPLVHYSIILRGCTGIQPFCNPQCFSPTFLSAHLHSVCLMRQKHLQMETQWRTRKRQSDRQSAMPVIFRGSHIRRERWSDRQPWQSYSERKTVS